MQDFLSFFKRQSNINLPHSFQKPGKETQSSRTHHQTTGRLMGSGRKSGKLNLVGKYHSPDPWEVKLKSLTNKPLNWATIKPVLDHFKIKHEFDDTEPYIKFLNKTGYIVHYRPDQEIWYITIKK